MIAFVVLCDVIVAENGNFLIRIGPQLVANCFYWSVRNRLMK